MSEASVDMTGVLGIRSKTEEDKKYVYHQSKNAYTIMIQYLAGHVDTHPASAWLTRVKEPGGGYFSAALGVPRRKAPRGTGFVGPGAGERESGTAEEAGAYMAGIGWGNIGWGCSGIAGMRWTTR